MRWLKKNRIPLCLALLFLLGAGLFLYPTISEHLSARQQAETISRYVTDLPADWSKEYQQLWSDATAYNAALGETGITWQLSPEEESAYYAYLSSVSDGIMSYITIPAIDCSLPIYHGVEETVLQVGVGHLPGSSLPVGGESTHCVLSGHNGLPSARLFTDLDQLQEGDTFQLHTLGVTLTYQVDHIAVLEPTDLGLLQIEAGKDYCTLVTCTPYGVNSHRLLVRGVRVADPASG